MFSRTFYRAAFVFVLVSGAILFPVVGLNQSQQPAQPPPPPVLQSQSPADDVVRVSTELVQTDVTVFDKQGRFVDQLTGNDFELFVDGKPQEISFFERVAFDRGIANESTTPEKESKESSVALSARQRTVLFYVDDLHLSPGSLVHTRKALLDFVKNGMGGNDQVAVTSSSGQIGFLQQFTNDRTVEAADVGIHGE
jgi:VWFA-related protein